MGIDPSTISSVPALPRLAAIIKRYEDLRHSGKVPESMKAKLRVPGDEYTLTEGPQGGWQFVPVVYDKHQVEGIDGWSNVWQTNNRFDRQPVRLRIEALMAAAPYDSPDGVPLADFTAPDDFPDRAAAPEVAADLQPVREPVKVGAASGRFTAISARSAARGAWAKREKRFSPPQNLSGQQALGLWVCGDGQGEVLNIQLRCPAHIVAGIGEHYIPIDFTGWRYFELIEPEGKRYADYVWPYGDPYSIYRESIDFRHVETLALWFNNLPPGKQATCYLSPIRALPLVKTKLINPALRIGEREIVFPVEIESGCYLEFDGASAGKLYGPQGELLREVASQGEVPVLEPGANEVRFRCDSPAGVRARARVTIISAGR
jgi:hypothetical protein